MTVLAEFNPNYTLHTTNWDRYEVRQGEPTRIAHWTLLADWRGLAVRAKIESVRWPDGPICPHCAEDERQVRHQEGRPPVPSRKRRGRPYIKKARVAEKRVIISLVERGGSVRSLHVTVADKKTVNKLVRENVARESRLHTDESNLYADAWKMVAKHETVNHSAKEYARDDVMTNSAEGFLGTFKRGFNGSYQHCRERHLRRYLVEYDFRYNHRIKLGLSDMAGVSEFLCVRLVQSHPRLGERL
jgi:ISXO2-like transposase domain/Transposase zinc-ribbon domain